MSEHPLDFLFHPRSIALVGVPSELNGPGADFFLALLAHGYTERYKLYPVNPKVQELRGLRCYPSLLDIPEPVDHVLSLVPAHIAPDLVRQAVEKGVRSLHFYTAGFAESGDEQLAALERELVGRAVDAGIRVLGPNCMGIYVPSEGISFSLDFPKQTTPGNILVISQSGANTSDLVLGLAARGARFSKAISFGNGRDIAAAELFEYAASDDESEVVVAYLEGVPDGPALLRALKACAYAKPTIILKGGLTDAGARAVSSHTASLAGSTAIFDALCRQAGAMRVETMEEAHDLTIAACTQAIRIAGPRAALVGAGGGFSVLAADAIARSGIDLPPLSEETQSRLRKHVPVAGNSIRNPIDAGFLGDQRGEAQKGVIRAVAADPDLDFTFTSLGPPPDLDMRRRQTQESGDEETPEQEMDRAREGLERERKILGRLAELQRETGRPILGIRPPRRAQLPRGVEDTLLPYAYEEGLAIFPSVPRAARAAQLILEWRRRREGLPAIV